MKNPNEVILNVKNPAQRLSKILNQLMIESDVDGVQLSKNTGIPVTTINRLRKNDSTNNPTLTTLIPLAEFFSVNVSQLIGDEPFPSNRIGGEHKPNEIEWKRIPHFTWEQSAKLINNNFKVTTEIKRYITTDIDIGDNAFAITMEGDSMYPRFPENTLFIIDPQQEVINRDFVLVLPIGNTKPQFKQVLIDGEDYYIKSLNRDFKEIKKIILNEDHRIIGVMVQARTEYKR